MGAGLAGHQHILLREQRHGKLVLLARQVERRPADALPPHGVEHGALVNKFGPAGVDQERARADAGHAHLRKPAPGLGVEPQMQRHDIGVFEQLVGSHVLDAVMLGEGLVRVHVEPQNVHAERQGPLGDFLADPAHADDTERLAHELHAGDGRPLAVPDVAVHLRDAPQQRKHEPDGQLSHGGMGDAGGDGDRNLPHGGHVHIDVVHLGAELRDHFQGVRPVQHPMAHRLIADDHRLDADDIRRHFIFRQHPRPRVCHDFVAGFLENVLVLTVEIEKRPRGDQHARSCHYRLPSLIQSIAMNPL